MRAAVDGLAGEILRLQGDGAYGRAIAFLDELGTVGEGLRIDLARLGEADIPVDILFEQGMAEELLGEAP